MELTVGYAAGLIALGIFLGRQFFPTALAYILSSVLGHADSAATWTWSAPVFQQSYWPSLLRTDIAYSHGVRPAVQWIYRLLQVLSFLFAIASIVTPLGLYDSFVATDAIEAEFVYAKDESFFGMTTNPRDNYTFTRLCANTNNYASLPCPFTNVNYTYTFYANGTYSFVTDAPVNVSVPNILRQIYSSGTGETSTVANYFDIQWRQVTMRTERLVDDVKTYMVGLYSSVQSIVLNNNIALVEGLIVDSVQARVGLRNHTVPVGLAHGATWQEDILFVEPQTACSDTNLTLDYRFDDTGVKSLVLTDRGGFANIKSLVNNDSVSVNWPINAQNNPSLQRRAEYTALSHNFLVAMYFNITNSAKKGTGLEPFSYVKSSLNQSFSIDARKNDYNIDGLQSIYMTRELSGYLGYGLPGYTNKSQPTISSNIYNITEKLFSGIVGACEGFNDTTTAFDGVVSIKCGMMRGAPIRQNQGLPATFDIGSEWSQKMYMCASASKVTIKAVTFSYNGTTPSLDKLQVTDIQEKKYDNNASLPLWGVESYGSKYTNNEINLIWGLVSEYYQGKSNVSTYRKPELYIPGHSSTTILDVSSSGKTASNMAASDFAGMALSSAYCNGPHQQGTDSCLGFDTTGSTDVGTYLKWLNLTGRAETASKVINLRFIDFVASGLVGAKGAGPDNKSFSRTVVPKRLKIRYHLPFAIPAILSAVALMVLSTGIVASWLLKRTKLADVRLHIQRLAPGRIFTTLLAASEHRSTLRMSGKSWSSKYGAEVIDLAEQDEALEPLHVEKGKESDEQTNIHIVSKS